MSYLFLMLLLPLLGSVTLLLLSDKLSLRLSAVISGIGLVGGFLAGSLSAIDFYQSADYQAGSYVQQSLWQWFHSPAVAKGIASVWSLRLDSVSIPLALTVLAASCLLTIYFAWMLLPKQDLSSDDVITDLVQTAHLSSYRYGLFFGFGGLLTTSVLLVVLAANLMLLVFGWFAMTFSVFGLFYMVKPSLNVSKNDGIQEKQSSHAAMIWLVLGDALLLCAVIFLYFRLGTMDISDIVSRMPELYSTTSTLGTTQSSSPSLAVNTMLALFVLACISKMALLPWQSWVLPFSDSHLQTQNSHESYSAGLSTRQLSLVMSVMCLACVIPAVYLTVRFHSVFAVAESLRWFLGGVGAVSAILFALTALVKRQLSSVMLYISLSQLGLLAVTVSLAAWQAAVIHAMVLVTVLTLFWMVFSSMVRLNEIAKGSLGLASNNESSSSVDSMDDKANGHIQLDQTRMKTLYVAAWLAIAGICALPWVSGRFFSQFQVLWQAWVSQAYFIYVAVLVVCFITALVLGRLMYVLFHRQSAWDDNTLNQAGFILSKDDYKQLNSMALYAPVLVLMMLVTPVVYFLFPDLSQVLPLSSAQLLLLQHPETHTLTYYVISYASLAMCLLGFFVVFYYYRVYVRRLFKKHQTEQGVEQSNRFITPLVRWQQRKPVALVRHWLANNYGLDAAYRTVFYRPYHWVCLQLNSSVSRGGVVSRGWQWVFQKVSRFSQSVWLRFGTKKERQQDAAAFIPLGILTLVVVTVFMLRVV